MLPLGAALKIACIAGSFVEEGKACTAWLGPGRRSYLSANNDGAREPLRDGVVAEVGHEVVDDGVKAVERDTALGASCTTERSKAERGPGGAGRRREVGNH
jgi:hypothetical protein